MVTKKKLLKDGLGLFLLFSSCLSLGGMSLSPGGGCDERGAFAYVACKDKRIYIVDLTQGKIVQTSPVLEQMGAPTCITLDGQNRILYVASERGFWQQEYSPIIAVDVSMSPMKVIRTFDLIVGNSDGPLKDLGPVFHIVVSPDGRSLYVLYGREDYYNGSTIIDARTGEITKRLGFYMTLDTAFSPDGRRVAVIWSHGGQAKSPEGTSSIKPRTARLSIFDIQENREVSRKGIENGRIQLQPPWAKIDGPLISLEGDSLLNLYDRAEGLLLSSTDVHMLTDLYLNNKYIAMYDSGKRVLLSMIRDAGEPGFVVTLDLVTGQIISKVEVGANPSNTLFSDRIPIEEKR